MTRHQVLFIPLLCALFFTPSAYAVPTAQEVLSNIAALQPNFVRLISAFSYVSGMLMVVRAIYKLKMYGELRTMMSSSTSIIEPIIVLIAGAMLLYLPTAVDSMTVTFLGEGNPLQYPGSANQNFDLMVKVILGIMYIVGGIAFIRGIFLFQRTVGQQAQPGTFGKAVTHIVGGIIAINLYAFWSVLKATLGFT